MTNQLNTIIAESNLGEAESKALLEQFQDIADLAAEWEEKAKTLVVTDESQTDLMETARVGRIALRDKRITVEKTRKALKEESLRKGKAIDGIAKFLRELIEPTEKYLESQEKFVELKKKAQEEKERAEFEEYKRKQAEAEAKKEAEAREKERLENERLRKEVEANQKAIEAERAKVDAVRQESERKAKAERERVQHEKDEAEAKAAAEKREIEEKARVAKEESDRKMKAVEDKVAADKADTVAILTDFERLLEFVRKVAVRESLDIDKLCLEAEQLYKSIIYKQEKVV